jgi:site-specific recombinase XerD
MHAKGRYQGKFIALGGLRKIPGPPESRYELMVVDENGHPVFHLSEWYRLRKPLGAKRTRDTYLDMLLPWTAFQMHHGHAWNDPPERIRSQVMGFLRRDVSCLVRPDHQDDGYLVETTGRSPLSKSSLGVFLAAITNLYEVLIDAGYYRFANPMRSQQLIAQKREHLRQVKNAGAPDHAGIRSESWLETHQSHPTGYFRQYQGKVWAPDVVMEPDEVQQNMREAVNWMIEHAPTQRDKIVLLLLRTTGARLSEVLGLTAGGYRKARHACQALVTNKGSQGREEKRIYFTETIERLLLKYLRTERAKVDPEGRKRLEQLCDDESLFLTKAGTPYTRASFYYHWYALFKRARTRYKVAFSPHDLRHLHVTRNIVRIRKKAAGNTDVEQELIDGFRQLMGWRSLQTLEVYTHTLNKRKALLEIVALQEEEENDLPEQLPAASPHRSTVGTPRSVGNEEDDCSWYEE